MANRNPKIENLIPANKRSLEEARENGKKGGIKSGEVRREKKLFKEALLVALEAKDDEGIYGLTKIIAGIVNEAQKGNPKAFEVIRDTIGEKPIEKNETTISNPPFKIEIVG